MTRLSFMLIIHLSRSHSVLQVSRPVDSMFAPRPQTHTIPRHYHLHTTAKKNQNQNKENAGSTTAGNGLPSKTPSRAGMGVGKMLAPNTAAPARMGLGGKGGGGKGKGKEVDDIGESSLSLSLTGTVAHAHSVRRSSTYDGALATRFGVYFRYCPSPRLSPSHARFPWVTLLILALTLLSHLGPEPPPRLCPSPKLPTSFPSLIFLVLSRQSCSVNLFPRLIAPSRIPPSLAPVLPPLHPCS